MLLSRRSEGIAVGRYGVNGLRCESSLPALLLAGVAALSSQPAVAQAPPVEGERIVVTAQRRPEAPESVPISLTARTGAELDRLQATDTPSLDKVVPSLVMMRTGPFTQPYLRGVGKRSTLGVENSVASYVDGVYLASPISALLDLKGVERVEVLNGPQGTLFGRNATGGVIQVVTRDPDAEPSAEAAMQGGTYGHLRGDLYLTGGNARIAGNLAVSFARNEGYGENLFTGNEDQGETDHSLAARSKWDWRPRDGLTLTLAADYQDIDQDFTQLPLAGFPPIGDPRVLGFRDSDQDAPNRYHFHYGGASAKAEAELGEAKLVSISAWRRMRARYGVDLDLGPLPLLSADVEARQDQLSQEFQLQSGTASRLRWLAGLYYIRIEEKYDPTTFSYGGDYSAGLGGRTSQILFAKGTASSLAAYGQATAPLGDKTRLTLGLRYTFERRKVRASGQRTFDTPPFIRPIPGLPLPDDEPFRNKEKFGELTWLATLDRDLSDRLLGYVSASRGFQSGGWNLQTPQNPAFDPERLDAFEAGLKYASSGGRLRADANIFYYDYSDLQVSAITPIGNATVNAASAEAFGIGVQFDWRLDGRSELCFGAQWLKARFDRFPNAACTDYSLESPNLYAPIQCDVSGNRLPFAPGLKLHVSASRLVSVGRAGSLLLAGSLAFNSGYFSEPDNVVEQDAYATLDGSVEWRPGARIPWVRLWGSNLTNSEYHDSLVTFPTTGVLQRPAAPRRYGITVGHAW